MRPFPIRESGGPSFKATPMAFAGDWPALLSPAPKDNQGPWSHYSGFAAPFSLCLKVLAFQKMRNSRRSVVGTGQTA